jgi:hypothetical protein
MSLQIARGLYYNKTEFIKALFLSLIALGEKKV